MSDQRPAGIRRRGLAAGLVAAVLVAWLAAASSAGAVDPYYFVDGVDTCPDGACSGVGPMDAAGHTLWVVLTPNPGTVADATSTRLARFDLRDFTGRSGDPGSYVHQLIAAPSEEISDIAVAPDGSLYVATWSATVFRYSAAGAPLGSFNTEPGAPSHLAAADDGSLYAAMVVPTPEGQDIELQRFSATGDPLGGRFGLADLAVADLDGFGDGVVVCDRTSGRALRFGADGAATGPFGPAGLAADRVRCTTGPAQSLYVIRPPAGGSSGHCATPATLTELASSGAVRRTGRPIINEGGCGLRADALAVGGDGTVIASSGFDSAAAVRVDTIPPVLGWMTLAPSSGFTTGRVGIHTDATDEGHGTLAVEAAVNGGPFSTVSGLGVQPPGRVRLTGPEGPYQIAVRVHDGAGLLSATTLTGTITLDTTRPQTTRLRVRARVPKRWRPYLRGRKRTYTRRVQPQIIATATDNLSGPAVWIYVRLKQAKRGCTWWSASREQFRHQSAEACGYLGHPAAIGGSRASYRIPIPLKRTGLYTAYVQAVDRAGNYEHDRRPTIGQLRKVSFRVIDSNRLRRASQRRGDTCRQAKATRRAAVRRLRLARRALRRADRPRIKRRRQRVIARRIRILRLATRRAARICRGRI